MSGLKDRGEQDVWYPIRASALSLAVEAKVLDRRSLDRLEPYEHVERIAAFAYSLLARAIELLDHVVSTCGLTTGRRPPSALPFELALDTAVRTSFDVGDLAELIRVEFKRRLSRLTHGGRSVPIVALCECDRAVAGVSKALSALDLAAARASNTPYMRDFTFELERSLSSRRAYATLSLQIISALVPGTDTPRFRFRGVQQAIDELVAQDTYQELRVGDRLLLRAAQQRLELWSSLAPADSEHSRATADVSRQLRLLVAVLGRINLRRELVEHDSALLREALEHVRSGSGEAFRPELAAKLHGLRGLNPELDLLLVSPDALQVEPWRHLLGSLAARYAHHGSSLSDTLPPGSGQGEMDLPVSSRTAPRTAVLDEEPTVRLPRGSVRDVLDEYLVSHCSIWPDAGLAALGGRTPRAAVATAEGRREVEALICEMERQFGGASVSDAYSFHSLRLELGLVPRARSS